ncbi:MAG: NADH-quinone oxidoreductase subunit L, partial [Actinomycetes bacterium]
MTAVYVAVLAPFLAALVGLFTGRRWPRTAVPVAVTGASLALLGALVLAVRALDVKAPLLYHESAHVATVPTGRLSFGIDLRVDGLAALVALAVAIVALAVQVYS